MEIPVPTEKSSTEADLLEQGWTRQFLASGVRLEEASESYASLGFEVHLEPAQSKDLLCARCQPPQPSATVKGWYVIYTRPRRDGKDKSNQEDDLW
jgi:hypothetical protein